MPEDLNPNPAPLEDDAPKKHGKGAATAVKANVCYAVLTLAVGSFTLGEHTIYAQQVIPVPTAVKALACKDTSPVEFFSDEEAAKKAVEKVKARYERKPIT